MMKKLILMLVLVIMVVGCIDNNNYVQPGEKFTDHTSPVFTPNYSFMINVQDLIVDNKSINNITENK